ncbi:NUDIX hydrolase [Sphingomonas sp.]|jgi:8-oxo-dGTP pyrophosphatase MutT (NUDIX family)|uniref:NUDIX hydrolase n=1 Tax=Sphingomonas sp. TaxID=28214 RepID=UPI002E31BD82|nr:NUDIX hydrolase [Sphingomonas sp.]HEX4693097.1 NUDIX hydrolase [Sphingomonas sp.]
MPDTPQTPIPAATLVLIRDRAGAPPDLLMVERAKAMVFAGGALVFPGGRIDPGDHALAAAMGLDAEDGPARIAAIRETIEEAGVPVGLTPVPDAATLDHLRERLHAGQPLGPLLDAHGLTLELGALTYFARWLPAHAHMRIFDTRFYLAAWPEGAADPVVDDTENVRLLWASAAQVLADCDAGRATVIFPTRRNLERLAQYGSHADAVADALAYPPRTITPFAEERDGGVHLCIPDGLGYPVTSEKLTGAVRG